MLKFRKYFLQLVFRCVCLSFVLSTTVVRLLLIPSVSYVEYLKLYFAVYLIHLLRLLELRTGKAKEYKHCQCVSVFSFSSPFRISTAGLHNHIK
jgi:hypothetical protein